MHELESAGVAIISVRSGHPVSNAGSQGADGRLLLSVPLCFYLARPGRERNINRCANEESSCSRLSLRAVLLLYSL